MSSKKFKNKFPRRFCPVQFLTCQGLTREGLGIVKWNGKIFWIEQLLPGEKARVVIFYQFKKHGYGRAVKLLNCSLDRALPLDHPKTKLGVYHLAHLNSQAQDRFKQSQLESVFGTKLAPIIVGKRTYYRNKVVLSHGGFKAPGRYRRQIFKPDQTSFDLMAIDFGAYPEHYPKYIIRRLEEEIAGPPGTKLATYDAFLGKKFRVTLDSFYQVNKEMATKAYEMMQSFVSAEAVVFDLYSGLATIAICLSDRVRSVYAVEVNKVCCQDAKANLAINQVKNVTLICQDVTQWITHTKIKPDVIVVDPPRAGLTPAVCRAINASKARRIIYLSCQIETQKRDIDLLTNYQVVFNQAFDFFPQTYHIENLVVLDIC
ncbi:RsmD family RNA methyltransferase [Mycoplasma sp. ATU-Cv-703]|uniref:RsmD family RNA methyltransferase n=1 Tax=Mycoplasma sp. ATU-Cv-703 TaxID=2498595 RepID=UPI000FDD7063